MTPERTRIAWRTPHPEALARALVAVSGRGARSSGDRGVPAGLAIAEGPSDELVLDGVSAAEDDLEIGLLAIGWATVELERWPRAASLGADELLAAAAAVPAESPLVDRPSVPVILLEPIREGRVAAWLARHGEGPAAVYVTTTRGTVGGSEGAAPRRVTGPFGSSFALVDPRHGPFLVACSGPYPRLPRPRTIDA